MNATSEDEDSSGRSSGSDAEIVQPAGIWSFVFRW
jgi:hypothetical protein